VSLGEHRPDAPKVYPRSGRFDSRRCVFDGMRRWATARALLNRRLLEWAGSGAQGRGQSGAWTEPGAIGIGPSRTPLAGCRAGPGEVRPARGVELGRAEFQVCGAGCTPPGRPRKGRM
jgi:hypothetical protein